MAMRPDGAAGVARPKAASSSGKINIFSPSSLIKGVRSAAVSAAAKNPTSAAAAAGRLAARGGSGGSVPRGGNGGGNGGGGYGGGGASSPSYGGGGVSTLSNGIVAEPMSEPPKPSLEDWRASDATFGAANKTIDTDLSSLLQQLADENARYQQDYSMGLRNLGWDAQAGGGKGGWNPDDLLGAFGQSRNNLFNDFSGRGLMDSSFFGQAQEDMTRNFERQRNDMNTDRDRVQGEYGKAQGRANADANNARQQALADAAARYSAMYGL